MQMGMTFDSLPVSAAICAWVLNSQLDVLGVEERYKIKRELSLLSVEHSWEIFITDGFI